MIDTRHQFIARKTVWTLFAAQSLGSAGIVATAAINTIVSADLAGGARWSGAPTAVYLIAGALAVFAWGQSMSRLGWRGGLTLGLSLAVAGSVVAASSVQFHSLILFVISMALLGIGNAALNLARFAAAEVHLPAERGRAVSNVVIGGTVGAVLGPWIVGPSSGWAAAFGWSELVGPYLGSVILFALAAVVVFISLRPEPREVGREIAAQHPESAPTASGAARTISQILRAPAAFTAIAAMVFGQAVMIMVMVITSLHMKNLHHELGDIGIVISSHVFGMYAFSILSGQLADRWGRGPAILIGAATLIAACLAAPLSPDVIPIGVALFLLGLGWNFCYVGGSSLLADQLSPDERGQMQGFNDLLIGFVSAAGSLGSGLVFAAVGYGVMGLVGAVAALIPLGLALGWQATRIAPPTAQPT